MQRRRLTVALPSAMLDLAGCIPGGSGGGGRGGDDDAGGPGDADQGEGGAGGIGGMQDERIAVGRPGHQRWHHRGRHVGFLPGNVGETLILQCAAGEESDRVTYDPGQGWPDEPGRSIQLDRAARNIDQNDLSASGCLSTARLPSEDFGTPGADNGSCD